MASEVALETASEAAVGLGAFEKSGILILAQDDFDDGFDTIELKRPQNEAARKSICISGLEMQMSWLWVAQH